MRRYGMSHFLGLLIFFISLSFCLSGMSFLSVWMGVEIMGLSLFLFFYMYESRVLLMSVFIYFWVSSVSGFGLLFSYYMLDFNQNIFFFFIILKLGMVPFMGWVVTVYSSLNFFLLFMMSSLVKLPLFMFLDMFGNNLWFLGMILSILSIFVSVLGVFSSEVKCILGYSAIGMVGDFFLFFFFSFDMFILSFLFYSWFLLMILVILSNSSVEGMSESSGKLTTLEFYSKMELLILGMFGLPPFVSFFIKLFFFFTMVTSGVMSVFFMSFYFFLMILMSLIYYRFYLVGGSFSFGLIEYNIVVSSLKIFSIVMLILSLVLYFVSVLIIFSFFVV